MQSITANAGALRDEVFLVVDMDGIAGYQTSGIYGTSLRWR